MLESIAAVRAHKQHVLHPIYRSEEIEKFSEALTDTLRQINLLISIIVSENMLTI